MVFFWSICLPNTDSCREYVGYDRFTSTMFRVNTSFFFLYEYVDVFLHNVCRVLTAAGNKYGMIELRRRCSVYTQVVVFFLMMVVLAKCLPNTDSCRDRSTSTVFVYTQVVFLYGTL